MGCIYSRPDNINPRVFQVWNVDGEGRNVKPGKIEVTESQLILYQRGDITVRWPLRSLRRYGFDAELFSFECGRRCPTGPGVYAFRCRRAEALFNILQEFIQNSGGGNGNISVSAIEDQTTLSTLNSTSLNSSGVLVSSNGNLINGTLPDSRITPAVDSAGYLEPITANNHNFQCPFISSSARTNGSTTASSPGGLVCIHPTLNDGMAVEWSSTAFHQSSTSLCCPCRKSSNHHYVNKDVVEQTCSTLPSNLCLMHQYVNSAVIATDPSRKCGCTASKCLGEMQQNTYVNSNVASALSLSPGHLPCTSGSCTMNCMNCVDINTNYAKLDDLLKQEQSVKRQKEQQHCYVNVKPESSTGTATNCVKCTSGRSSPTDKDLISSPTNSITKNQRSRLYANLGTSSTMVSSDSSRELAKTPSQVNYAVLDLDKHSSSNSIAMGSPASAGGGGATASGGNPLLNSPVRTPEGYAQIDFDKTVALSNSAIPCPSNDDSIRKTRHNAVIPSSSVPS